MKCLITALAVTLLSACAHVPSDTQGTPLGQLRSQTKPNASQRSLRAFNSLEELRQFTASVTAARRVAHEKELAKWRAECRATLKSDADAAIVCSDVELATVTVSGTAPPAESITNNQHAELDEGDIVKRLGDTLIILRRGRLFTIAIGGGQLNSLAVADAFGPASDGIEPDHTWYDELLVWQRTVVVVGYSYKRGGTEIGLFDVGGSGELQYRATYHLRSDDYYSTRNYASRLMGDRLVLFTSLSLPENVDTNAFLPALRRWNPRGSNGLFETIAPINRVFRPVAPIGVNASVHSLIVCNLAAPSLECEATVVLGDGLAAHYASPTAAYAWTTAWNEDGQSRSVLYRMPFDGSPVTAIGVVGHPVDQLAFLEDAHQHLNVIAAQENHLITLLRLPLSAFSDGSLDAPDWFYRSIARGDVPIARFVGAYVLVGTWTFHGDAKASRRLVVAEWERDSTVSLELTHDVERIEPMGPHAAVVGLDDDRLSITTIRLGPRSAVADTFVRQDAAQSDYRTHAFFYRHDSDGEGVFGLPIVTAAAGNDDTPWDRASRMLFVHSKGLALLAAGTLDPPPAQRIDDHCQASCIDWYGNARAIFIEDRIFALSGYDLMEGRVGGRAEIVGHLNFAPSTVDVP